MTISKTWQIEGWFHRIEAGLYIIPAGSCFLALLSQLAIPLPFTPVPLTLQTFAIFVLGGVLGGRRAMCCVVAYLIQGCFGLPVFAGGKGDILWFFDCKAGFLISFILAAYLIGKMLEKRPHVHFVYLLFSLTLGQIVISLLGMAWLSLYVGLSNAFLFGILPFLSGAAIKIGAGALCIKGYLMCRKKMSY